MEVNMTRPNFHTMTRKELLTYMLENREDNEAFYTFMDKVNSDSQAEFFPAPQSIEDLSNFPQLLKQLRRERKED